MNVAHDHQTAGDCLASVGYVHVLSTYDVSFDRALVRAACGRCPWVSKSDRWPVVVNAADEHDRTHRTQNDRSG